MPDGSPLILGSQNNTASLETGLVRSGGVLLSAFSVVNDGGTAVDGSGLLVGVSGTGENAGVYGQNRVHGTGESAGVYGQDNHGGFGVVGGSPDGTGVIGRSGAGAGVFGLSDNVAVYAHNGEETSNQAYLGTRCCAGDFYGVVYVHGRLYIAGSQYFRIDHPLDPANKVLTHSAVESSEMKNIYDGVAILDEGGEALVELPEYFEALNRDFRYQLTPIGASGRDLHIAEEIHDNRFRIGGGSPGMKVSWQVSSVRKDAWAETNRTPVEEEKPAEERGYYLHPALYGESEERGIAWVRYGEQTEEHQGRMEELRRRMEEGRRGEALPPETTT